MNQNILSGIVGVLIGVVIGLTISPYLPTDNRGRGMMEERTDRMMMSGGNVDRHFIEQMIPHHEGAIAMAKRALEQSARPEIISLAADIIEAQEREITTMQNWYTQWYGKLPSTTGGHMMHMEGMEGDLAALQNAQDFDKEFLSQMIVHHEMAVMMAQMLESGTERSEMKQLASDIITSQTHEIEMMRSWGASWFGI